MRCWKSIVPSDSLLCVFCVLVIIARPVAAITIEAPSIAARPPDEEAPIINERMLRFSNLGNLQGFTGANQKERVLSSDIDGGCIRCVMIRTTPDTPTGGCHAEAHLAQLSDGSSFGSYPGFKRIVTYEVKFDDHCDAADIAFFQIKNHEGQQKWFYLIAIWREAKGRGQTLLLQTKPKGISRLLHCDLSKIGIHGMTLEEWHKVTVEGYFSDSPEGWIRVHIDGKLLEWFYDDACTENAGAIVAGPSLPDLPGSKWQLQLGGYGFFKDKETVQAEDYIRRVQVESWR